MGNEGNNNQIQSVNRVLDILELLSSSLTPMGVAEVAERLGLNRTTVYGLVNTLIQRDYLVKSDSGRVEISGKLYSMSYLYPNRLPVVQYATGHMIELSERYGVSTHLGTMGVRGKVLLVKAQFPKVLANARSGSVFPLHASSMGKVLLAYLPAEQEAQLLDTLELHRYTAATITDKEQLRKELELVRQQGYGRDCGEYIENTSCIAFPILNDRGQIVAALSLSGTPDLLDARLHEIIPDALRRSKNCSMEIGWCQS